MQYSVTSFDSSIYHPTLQKSVHVGENFELLVNFEYFFVIMAPSSVLFLLCGVFLVVGCTFSGAVFKFKKKIITTCDR